MDTLKYFLVANLFVIGLISANTFVRRDDPNGFIIDGFKATIEDNPWQVSLQIRSSHNCGGSIIGKKWVLTAGHCASPEDPSRYSIRVGSANRMNGSVIELKRVIRHEGYNATTIDFDFSLLELAEELTFSDKIQPIALPSENIIIEDGTISLVSGWGTMQYGKPFSPQTLRAVYIPVVGTKECEANYSETKHKVTDRMICAGYEEGGKSPCHGDSGGPLSIEMDGDRVLIGTVSWAAGCALPKYPEVFGRITSVRSWIRNETGI